MSVLVEQLYAAAVDDRLAGEAGADAPGRVLEIDQPLRVAERPVEDTAGAIAEGTAADHQGHANTLAPGNGSGRARTLERPGKARSTNGC